MIDVSAILLHSFSVLAGKHEVYMYICMHVLSKYSSTIGKIGLRIFQSGI